MEGSYAEHYLKEKGLTYDNGESGLLPFYKGFDNWSFINSSEYFGEGFVGLGENYVTAQCSPVRRTKK